MELPDYAPYFKGLNFGTDRYEDIVLEGLMTVSCGFVNGNTLTKVLQKLHYVMPSENGRYVTTTVLGEHALYELYSRLKRSAGRGKAPEAEFEEVHIPVLVPNPNIKTSIDMTTMPAFVVKDTIQYRKKT